MFGRIPLRSRVGRFGALVVACAMFGAWVRPAESRAEQDAPVLVTIDTFRADYVGALEAVQSSSLPAMYDFRDELENANR